MKTEMNIPLIQKTKVSQMAPELAPSDSSCCAPKVESSVCCTPSKTAEENAGACCAQPEDGTACCNK